MTNLTYPNQISTPEKSPFDFGFLSNSWGATGGELADAMAGTFSSGTPMHPWVVASGPADELPQGMQPIVDAIVKSKSILDLPYDWDDDGSPPYLKSTWERTKKFLLYCARQLWKTHSKKVDAPRILPGPDGSIDLHWKTPQRELLVNIPEELDEPVRYYGDNQQGQIVKGTLNNSANNQWLILWLMQ